LLSDIVTTPGGWYKSRTMYLLHVLNEQLFFRRRKFRRFFRTCGQKLAKCFSFLRNRDCYYAQIKI
jgi:hypothetical protein